MLTRVAEEYKGLLLGSTIELMSELLRVPALVERPPETVIAPDVLLAVVPIDARERFGACRHCPRTTAPQLTWHGGTPGWRAETICSTRRG